MKYPTRRILGEGSFAVTFLSEDENGRPVVVKRFKTAIQYKDENKWEREANLLRALDHIQIPRYVDHYIEKVEERRLPHLVMAFVEGQTMQDVWKMGGYTEGQVLGWIQQILHILSYLQALSPPIMHRDIKPSNLLLTSDGQIFLVDFGSAIDDISRTFGHSFTGSLGYQSPEQIRGEPTIRSDLYSVGALAVGFLCGKDPSQMLDGMRLRWENTCLHLPMPLQNWLDKMLAYHPSDRFAHAKDALEALPSNVSIPNIPAAVIRKTEGATDLFAELLAEEEEKQQEVDTAKRRAKLAAEEEKRREAALVERKRILAQRREEEAAQRKARAIASLDAQEKALVQDLERDWKRGLAAIGAQRIQPEALVRVVKKAFSDRMDLTEDGFTRTISHPIWLFALQYQSGVYNEESLIYFEYIMAHVSSEIKADVDIQQKEDAVKAAEEKKKEARKELNGLTLFQGLFQ
ncbi:MAG: protein kinase, partial [Myxococcota bacterium]|nr:protein kinase [Myxococcota bacterium]